MPASPTQSLPRWAALLHLESRKQLNEKKPMKKGLSLLQMGVLGFAIVLSLNLLGLFALNQPAAEFFTEKWWPTWFTCYAVWGILITAGAALKIKKTASASQA